MHTSILFQQFSIVEFTVDLLVLPLTAINFYVISSTAILHFNLKLVLCMQSLGVVVFATGRCATFLTAMIYNISTEYSTVKHIFVAMTVGGMSACGWIGLFMIFERIYGTLYVKRYEQMKTPLFNAIWILCLVRGESHLVLLN